MAEVAVDANVRERRASLWTPAFMLLCLTVLLGYAHQSMLTPLVPLYVEDQGGSAFFAGLVLLAFSVPSFLVRPLFGYMADAWTAAGVLGMGLLLLALGGVIYLLPLLAFLFVGGVVRGLGWAGVNTGGYTLLANVAPAARRGEASGYYTAVTSSASIVFPGLGLLLIDASFGGFHLAFLIGSAIALAGLPLAFIVSRPRGPTSATPVVAAPAEAPVEGMLDRGVLLATALNFSSTLAAPALGAFLPLYAKDLGIGSIGFYYVAAGITSIVIRPLIGAKSDTMGRGPALAVGFVAQFCGFLLILAAQNLGMILVGGVFTSFGSALNNSSTTALAMDLANPARRGKAMATFSISFQLGVGIGSIIAGGLADLVGFRGMYAGSATIIACGMVLLLLSWRSLPKPHLVVSG
ncbi:MAG TPA: MFS transporter [Dehalococcoidia bacterium]